jgi:hypothetical protein
MALASLVLAMSLGQACPTPQSPWGPPPCAAANLPGCLPGYRPQFDRYGRFIYACDLGYVQPPGEAPQVALAQPPRGPPPGAQVGPGSPAPPEGRGHVGIVLMSGVSAFPSYTRLEQTRPEVQLTIEFRGTEGGFRLRLVGDYTAFGKIGEISLKYDLLDGFFLRPFLALGIGAASIDPDPGLRGEGSASAGVDLYLGRDFFLTGELKGRVFTEGTQGRAHGLAISDSRQTSFLAGMGFYF